MKTEEIAKIIDPEHPNVYAPTYAPTTLFFKDGSVKSGYFQKTEKSDKLKNENILTFVEFGENAQRYQATADERYVTTIDGNEVIQVQYPRLKKVKYDQIFKINANMVSPTIPVRVGGITMGPGINFGNGVSINGINLFDYKNRIVEGYIDNGVFVIKGFR